MFLSLGIIYEQTKDNDMIMIFAIYLLILTSVMYVSPFYHNIISSKSTKENNYVEEIILQVRYSWDYISWNCDKTTYLLIYALYEWWDVRSAVSCFRWQRRCVRHLHDLSAIFSYWYLFCKYRGGILNFFQVLFFIPTDDVNELP